MLYVQTDAVSASPLHLIFKESSIYVRVVSLPQAYVELA